MILAPAIAKTVMSSKETKRDIYQGHLSGDNWHLKFWVGVGRLVFIDKW